MTIWLNGTIRPASAGTIDATDRGFTLSDGLFETIRIANHQPQYFERHMARLKRGGEVLGIAVPASSLVRQAITDLLAATGLSDAALRVTVTRGPGKRGVAPDPDSVPTLLLSAHALSSPLKPAQIIIAQSTRRNEASPLSRIKSLNYGDNILARLEAQRAGADDAVLLNVAGNVAEATAANVFVRIDGTIVTPPVDDGALPGIIRGLLLERGQAVEASLSPEQLVKADAGFLSNSLGLRPIARIADHELNLAGLSLADTLWQSIVVPV